MKFIVAFLLLVPALAFGQQVVSEQSTKPALQVGTETVLMQQLSANVSCQAEVTTLRGQVNELSTKLAAAEKLAASVSPAPSPAPKPDALPTRQGPMFNKDPAAQK